MTLLPSCTFPKFTLVEAGVICPLAERELNNIENRQTHRENKAHRDLNAILRLSFHVLIEHLGGFRATVCCSRRLAGA